MLKIFVSGHTYRTEAEQLKKLRAKPELSGAPLYRPEDIPFMFRKTRRVVEDTYYASSVACFAPTKEKFVEFIANCRKANISLGSVEEDFQWSPNQPTSNALNAWKLARINGAASVGGQNTAKAWKAKMKDGIEKAKTLWGLPSKQYSIKDIEAISGISRGAIVRELGNRFVAQYNYQAAVIPTIKPAINDTMAIKT